MIEDLVHDNLHKASSCQRFRSPRDEDQGKALENEQENTLEDVLMEKTGNLNPNEDVSSTK